VGTAWWALAVELKSINESLWRIEDDIRSCERDGDFGPRFIELVHSVYETNDRRAAVKRRINEWLGSEIVEEKSYRVANRRPLTLTSTNCDEEVRHTQTKHR
jgi:hypothetical protein